MPARHAVLYVVVAALLASCSGAGLPASPTNTPRPVSMLPVPAILVDPQQECNIPMLSTFVIDDAEALGADYFQRLGEQPSLLDDADFVAEARTDAESRLEMLIEKAQLPGPLCLAEYRTLQLQVVQLEQHFWALVEVRNLNEAGKIDDQIVELYNRIAATLADLNAGL